MSLKYEPWIETNMAARFSLPWRHLSGGGAPRIEVNTQGKKSPSRTTQRASQIGASIFQVRIKMLGWENILLTNLSNGLSVQVSFEGQSVLLQVPDAVGLAAVERIWHST